MEKTPLYFRCYAQARSKKGKFVPKTVPKPNKSIVLVFDTETTADTYENLHFGSCVVWVNSKPQEFYVFYDDSLSADKVEVIEDFCKAKNHTIISKTQFVEEVFYPYVYTARATCVGFNLPFDLSRLALDYGKARKMHNGISLKLSENPMLPRIVVRKLDSKSSFIEFVGAVRIESEKKLPKYKGCFVDLKMFTFALTNISYSLKKALKDFECKTRKIDTEEHGRISENYLEYNVNDTVSTYELYLKCLERYSFYCLDKDESKLFSPASIGKEHLKKIGIRRFSDANPNFPKELLGNIMMTYFGGRTETRIRKTPTKVSYVDFTSMYPTVYVLLGMHTFLTAQRIGHYDSTKNTQELLDNVTKQDVVKPEFWRKITTICKIMPDNDILPARARYGNKDTSNIGINYLRSSDGTGIWYALPDIIASKFLAGKTPKITEAITFFPEDTQEGLQVIEVLKGIWVKPEEDFIKSLIEKRIQIKQKLKEEQDALSAQEQNQQKINQNILKIIANSTSYGIFIQEDMDHHDEKKEVDVYGLDVFAAELEKTEKLGPFFNPAMSVFLTAGSRLILATAESLVLENDGYVAYCDTDSVFVSPQHVKLVQDFFAALKPV